MPRRGGNGWGELGYGDSKARGADALTLGSALPTVALGSGASALALALGGFHTCALIAPRADSNWQRSAKCWGANAWGQLGYGDAKARGQHVGQMGDALPALELAAPGSDDEPVELSAGMHFTCARLEPSGAVKCWGANVHAQLGFGAGAAGAGVKSGGSGGGSLVVGSVGAAAGEMGVALPAVRELRGARVELLVSAADGYFSCARLAPIAGNAPAGLAGDAAGSVLCWPLVDGLPERGGEPTERPNGPAALEGNYGEVHRVTRPTVDALADTSSVRALSIAAPPTALGTAARQAGVAASASTPPRVEALALSKGTVCAIVGPNGELRCYGYGGEGQLGRGETATMPLPTLDQSAPIDLGASCLATAGRGRANSARAAPDAVALGRRGGAAAAAPLLALLLSIAAAATLLKVGSWRTWRRSEATGARGVAASAHELL